MPPRVRDRRTTLTNTSATNNLAGMVGAAPTVGGGTYTVGADENLLDIAKTTYGYSEAAADISRANGGIRKPRRGAVLRLPLAEHPSPIAGMSITQYPNTPNPVSTGVGVQNPLSNETWLGWDVTEDTVNPAESEKARRRRRDAGGAIGDAFSGIGPGLGAFFSELGSGLADFNLTADWNATPGEAFSSAYDEARAERERQQKENRYSDTAPGTGSFAPTNIEMWQEYANTPYGQGNPQLDAYMVSQGMEPLGTYDQSRTQQPNRTPDNYREMLPSYDGLLNGTESLDMLEESIGTALRQEEGSGTFSSQAIQAYERAYAQPYGENPGFDKMVSTYMPFYRESLAKTLNGQVNAYGDPVTTHIPTAVLENPGFPWTPQQLMAFGFVPNDVGSYWQLDPETSPLTNGQSASGGGGMTGSGGGRKKYGRGGYTSRGGNSYSPKLNGLIRWRGVGF